MHPNRFFSPVTGREERMVERWRAIEKKRGGKGHTVRPQEGIYRHQLEVISVVAHDGLDEELVAHHALAG